MTAPPRRRLPPPEPPPTPRDRSDASHNVFTELVWKDPKGRPITQSDIHRLMGDFLDECYEKRVPGIILAPLGSGKSEQGQAFCARALGRDPALRVGIVCDKDDHAAQRVDNVGRYMELDEDYRALYPDAKVKSGKKRNRLYFRTTANRYSKDWSLEGAGVLSSGTGTRKDIIFFDDCVTKKNAILEPAQRERVKGGYDGTWLGRIVPSGWHFYIGTAYHADDLTQVLLEKTDRHGNFVYAALIIGVSDDFDAYDVKRRMPGQPEETFQIPLWEGEWDSAAYMKRHDELVTEGSALEWYTGYKNMILDPAAMEFREPWFKQTYPVGAPEDYPIRVIYGDPASSSAAKADNFAGWVLGYNPRTKTVDVLDGWYVRNKGLGERVDLFLDIWDRWRPHIAAIEGQHELSFGQRIEEVATERGLPFRLRRLKHKGEDKESRIAGLAPLVERAKIRIDGKRWPWVIAEAVFFPKAKYDDALDALSGAYTYIRRWLRARGTVPDRFSLRAQYDATRQRSVAGGFKYRTPRPSKPEGRAPLERFFFR